MQAPVATYQDQIEQWRNRVYDFLACHQSAGPDSSSKKGKKLL
jgi:hypothetical protein